MDSLEITFWYWLAAGIVLIASELIIPSFTIIWFGLGALVVAALKAIVPDANIAVQVLTWSFASIFFTVVWYKIFKPQKTVFNNDQILAAEGEVGLVVKAPLKSQDMGLAKFSIPLLGADEWFFQCDQTLVAGDKIIIKSIQKNHLIVTKK